MNLTVKHKKPYSIVPLDKYNICKYTANPVMNEKSYTLFVDVKINKDECDKEAGIIVRPGMHAGFLFAQPNLLKFGFWFFKNDEPIYKEVFKLLTDDDFDEHLFCVATDDADKKIIKVYVNSNLIGEIDYNEYDRKHSYVGTPYYFGVANPFLVARPFDYYGSFNYRFAGLLDVVVDDIEELKQIQEHITVHPRLKYNIFKEDYKYKPNFSFYFDFENQSNYKVWDVSENNNFLCRILDRDNNLI